MKNVRKEFIEAPVKNTGLIYEEPKEQDWILGSSPLENREIFPDGHGWPKYRPEAEIQRNRHFDTFSCVTFAVLKALVMYLRVNYGVTFDLSEVFTAVMSGTVPGRGNSVRNVLESVRKDGFLAEYLRTFTPEMTKEQFFSPIPEKLIELARNNLLEWEINWEIISTNSNVNHTDITNALRYSPIIAVGYAWIQSGKDGMYYDQGNYPNHCFLIDDYDENDQRKLIANDSYPHDFEADGNYPTEEFLKVLNPNFRIWSAHKITAYPIIKAKDSLLTKFINMFKEVIRDIHGGYWFIKDGKRQKINSIGGLMTVIFRNFGIAKDNVSDDELGRFQLTNEFFK